MLGPRLAGANGVALVPLTVEDQKRYAAWASRPEITYFWGPRHGNWTEKAAEERFARIAKDPESVNWAIQVDARTVGFTGIDDIDWIRRQGESYIIIGEHELHRRGIASEAMRLRTEYAFRELNLHRVFNWVVYDNVGSRRGNEKAGYTQQGIYPAAFRRGRRVHDMWLGEVLRSEWEKR